MWKKKSQKQLAQAISSQDDYCHCGKPIPPMCRTFLDSCLCGRFLLAEHEYTCSHCGEKHIRVG
jgi:hypothetical protein